MKLTINGQPREVAGPVKLPDLLHTLGVNTQFVAVAINGEVLDKAAFPSTEVRDGDTLEIVRPVGGGAH